MKLPLSAYPFLKSVMVGAIVGTGPVVVMIVMMILGSLLHNGVTAKNLLAAAFLLLLPVACAGLVIGFFSLLIGLPLTGFLSCRGWEAAPVYILAGAISGGIVGLVYDLATSGSLTFLLLPVMSAGSGATTGWMWWKTARRHLR